MKSGTRFWWKRGLYATLPVVFEHWRRQKLAASIRVPHNGRSHEVLTSCIFRATDADAWTARVAELREAELALEERRRLLDSKVDVGALVRELELVLVPKRRREQTIEAVLDAARRASPRP
jgi:hypothetical protein